MKAASPTSPILTGATTGGNRAWQWNRWRERYNPLRGLNISRCVTLLEQYQRGEMADPQWVYFFIEQSDADLFAILERREAAILQLDWDIKLTNSRWPQNDSRRQDFDNSLALEQACALRAAYEGLDNLYEAIAHLQLATFRGYAHCEKYRNADGDIYHLELVDQWNVVRDLLRGRWKYNPEALSVTFDSVSKDNLIEPADFLIRERDRHVNRLALLKFIRANLSEKDWDAFIEIYGIPSGVVIGPAGVPSDKENEYQSAAQAIAEGGSGYLPNGSDYKPNTLPTGTDPFRPRLDFLTEKLVLAGTGGLLTMLAQSGSGTLAGGAHQQAFEAIARAEARKISELFQHQFDREIIQRHFSGSPTLAYFELAAHEPLDPGTVANHVQRFAAAGYRIDLAQLEEKSGYQLTDTQAAKEEDDESAPPELETESVLLNRNLAPEEIERWITVHGHRVPIRKKNQSPAVETFPPSAHHATRSRPSPPFGDGQSSASQLNSYFYEVGKLAEGVPGGTIGALTAIGQTDEGFLFGLFDSPADYLQQIGEVWVGYGEAANEAAMGIAQMVMHPIQTVEGLAYAAAHLDTVARTIWRQIKQNWQSGNRGKGKVVGDALIAVATSGLGAEGVASKLSQIGRALTRGASRLTRKALGRELIETVGAASLKFDEFGRLPRTGRRQALAQVAENDCGPTCVGMVLDTVAPERAVTRVVDFALDSSGTDIAQLVRALNENGLKAVWYQVGRVTEIGAATAKGRPVIAHIQYTPTAGHFVVVDGITKKLGRVVLAIREPTGGLQYYQTIYSFMKYFSGYIVALE